MTVPSALTQAQIDDMVEGLRVWLTARLGEPATSSVHMQAGIRDVTRREDDVSKYEHNGCARLAIEVTVNPPFRTADAWMVMRRCDRCGTPWMEAKNE